MLYSEVFLVHNYGSISCEYPGGTMKGVGSVYMKYWESDDNDDDCLIDCVLEYSFPSSWR